MPPLAKSLLAVAAVLCASAVIADALDNSTSISLGTGITVFGLAFGAWAGVLGWVMFVMRREFADLRQFVREESERRRIAEDRAHEDRLHLERRLTEIEANWRNHSRGPNT